MSANQLVHPDDHDMYTRLCDRAHRTGQECSRPGLRFVRRDGSVLRGDLRLHSVLDADDRLLFLVEMVPAWHDDAPAEPGSAGSDPEMIAVGPSPDLLWICSFCCKLRNAAGGWTRIESYIEARYGVGFSHGVCDTCRNEHYGPFMK